MPKEILHIGRFGGVIGAADERDLPPGAAAYALNLDLTTEEGTLLGLPLDTTAAASVTGKAFALLGDGTEAVYYDPAAVTVNHLPGLPAPTPASLGSVTSTGAATAASDGEAVHMGLGASSTARPQYVGYIRTGQFGGSAPSGAQVEDAELTTFPASVSISSSLAGATGVQDGFFKNGYGYFYGYSFVYDGLQEGPLKTAEEVTGPLSGGTGSTSLDLVELTIAVVAADINPRITAINLYRAESPTGSSAEPSSDYTLVAAIDLVASTGWSGTTTKTYTFTDNGVVGASFQDRTEFAETLEHMQLHYAVSCAADGYHFVADVWHADLLGADGYVFRSKPYRFDTFDWSNDFLKLPTTPNALVAYAGRLYAFGTGRLYTINPAAFTLEDTFEGIGAFSRESIAATDRGLFFSDNDQLYRIAPGGTPEPIGLPIIANAYDAAAGYRANTNTTSAPTLCAFSAQDELVCFLWKNSTTNLMWCYHTRRGEWSLVEAPHASDLLRGVLQGASGEAFVCAGTNLYRLFGSSTRRAWKWYSGRLHNQGMPFTVYEAVVSSYGSSTTQAPDFYWREDDGSHQSGAWTQVASWTAEDGETYSAVVNSDATAPWKKVREWRCRLEAAGTIKVRELDLTIRRRDPR